MPDIVLPECQPIDVYGVGDYHVVAGRRGSCMHVIYYVFKVSDSVTLSWKTSGGTALSGPMTFAHAGDGMRDAAPAPFGFWRLPEGQDLVLSILSGTGEVGGAITVLRA